MNQHANITRRTALLGTATVAAAPAAAIAEAAPSERVPADIWPHADAISRILRATDTAGPLTITPTDAMLRMGPFESPIAALFRKWDAIHGADFAGRTNAESTAACVECEAIRRRMLALSPITATDLAMQLVADTDHGESVPSDTFFEVVRTLALAKKA